MNDNIQTNIKQGTFSAIAAEDLTSKEGLVVLLDSSGVSLPTALTDITAYVLTSGDQAGSLVQIKPLNANDQVRIFLKGTCNAGDLLVMASPSTSADKGKVRVLPTSAGTYEVVAIAEEGGVDLQAIKCRGFSRQVVISS